MPSRRNFLSNTTKLLAGIGTLPLLQSCGGNESLPKELFDTYAAATDKGLFFKISLAQWSLNTLLFRGELDHLGFADVAKNKLGISAIEYVSTFFSDKIDDRNYLKEMNQRAADLGVKQLLIMVDAQGSLGTLDEKQRLKAVENHFKWLDAAKFLGCHSIRVNAAGKGPAEKIRDAAVDSLRRLAEHAAPMGLNVVVENHGGYSSNAKWLAEVMKKVNLPNCGTLPDLGNFMVNWFPYERYDPYIGTKELMPFAKGVSAKTHEFDEAGNETKIDYYKMLKIVEDAGFNGHIGIEYEGFKLDRYSGILATKNLLIKAGSSLTLSSL